MISTKSNFDNLKDNQAAELIKDEARIANDLQRDYPGMTRTEALKAAKQLLAGTQFAL